MIADDPQVSTVSRSGRRKARTRQALLDAAKRLLAQGDAASASIAEITEIADVGLGSFYNHFDDKDSLFDSAVAQVVEQWGAELDRIHSGSVDPVERFVSSYRMSVRAAFRDRLDAEIIDRLGFALLDSSSGLAPRVRRDLRNAVDAGALTIEDFALATAQTAGQLLALVHTWLGEPDAVGEAEIDRSAEDLLRSFGLRLSTARRLAHKPLSP